MAIYHLHSGFVSRSSGRTSVQSAAYICGEKLHEDYRDQIVDFTKRSHDVISYKTIVPDNCKYMGLNIWNEIENFEKCLSLLVKIEDDKKDLIKIFIDRYQYLMFDVFSCIKDIIEKRRIYE